MSEIKLIATDIDNTLLNSKKEITPRARRALQRASAQGIRVCLVSGRPVSALRYLQEELNIPVAYGSLNGSLSLFGDTVIGSHRIPFEQMKTIIAFLRHYHCVINIYGQDTWYTEPDDWTYEMESRMLHMKGIVLDDLLRFVEESDEQTLPLYKLVITHKDSHVIQALEKDLKRLDLGLNVYQSAPNFIEINRAGVDKGLAVREFASYWHIDLADVFAIGDYFNDLSMLQTAGVSVAMLNAPRGVKEMATSVSQEDMNHEGFALEIEKILDGKRG